MEFVKVLWMAIKKTVWNVKQQGLKVKLCTKKEYTKL